MTKNKNNYKDSGVDIGQGQKFVEDIKKLTSKSQHSFSWWYRRFFWIH